MVAEYSFRSEENFKMLSDHPKPKNWFADD